MARKNGRLCPSGTCDQCGQWADHLELDHKLALTFGGTHTKSNLQWLCPDCHKQKSSVERKAWKPSPEWYEKQRAAKRGKKHSPETREKMRQAHLKRNQDPAARAIAGRRTPEGLANIRRANRTRELSEETRIKMSDSARRAWAKRKLS